jgi:chitin synthase
VGVQSQQLQTINNLTNLTSLSNNIIIPCIHERFTPDTIYTTVGSPTLVAVNPHECVPSNVNSALQKYAAEYHNTAKYKSPLPPHIFQLANNMYCYMRRMNQDQHILLTCVDISFKMSW